MLNFNVEAQVDCTIQRMLSLCDVSMNQPEEYTEHSNSSIYQSK